MAKKWQLIDNNKHKVYKFDTKKEMITFAKEKNLEIKPGRYASDQVYFTESLEIIPGDNIQGL